MRPEEPKDETQRTRLAKAAFFALGAVFALLVNRIVVVQQEKDRGTMNQLRLPTQGDYAYIHPLLACDAPENRSLQNGLSELERTLEEEVAAAKERYGAAEISVYLRLLDSGEWAGVEEEKAYPAASLVKIPYLIAYQKIAQEKPDVLDAQLTYPGDVDEDMRQAIKPRYALEPGKAYRVSELLRYMVAYSSNNATRLLAENLDPTIIPQIFAELDVPLNQTKNNTYVSPRDFSYFFRILYNASYLSRELSEKSLALLTETDFKDGLVAGVPENIKVAHKFGERMEYDEKNVHVASELHDCGIVFHRERPYFLCVMTRGKDLEKLKGAIKDISKRAYEEVDRKKS